MVELESGLVVHQVEVGPAENFIYWLGDKNSKEMVVIDPAWDVPFIRSEAERLGYTIVAVWLTHDHGDHINGVAELLTSHPVPVYQSRHATGGLRPAVDGIIDTDDGDTLSIGSVTFSLFHTPGHSPDGQCFLHGNQLIAGDTIFIDGCGRCDLPGSDVEAMYNSIHNKVMALPDDTVIYPGHNYGPKPSDTLANQKKTNRFMLAKTKEAFIKERMG
ncbi:MBL fold metallo-hydrolase [Chloroflexi bacterium TSY]|nr:MBL fold metallo-hydrolase [Chloroflexi bacterium TSY]